MIAFSFANEQFEMSLTAFYDKMDFPSDGLILESRSPNSRPADFDHQQFWFQITGRKTFEARSTKACLIHNLVFHYIHRVMACTIVVERVITYIAKSFS